MTQLEQYIDSLDGAQLDYFKAIMFFLKFIFLEMDVKPNEPLSLDLEHLLRMFSLHILSTRQRRQQPRPPTPEATLQAARGIYYQALEFTIHAYPNSLIKIKSIKPESSNLQVMWAKKIITTSTSGNSDINRLTNFNSGLKCSANHFHTHFVLDDENSIIFICFSKVVINGKCINGFYCYLIFSSIRNLMRILANDETGTKICQFCFDTVILEFSCIQHDRCSIYSRVFFIQRQSNLSFKSNSNFDNR
ncbi:hypothetical protein RF11_11761 [Thelohanellus kitauei]|uniref:Uncharacterized protein n=1 Tax=Thelohanellus kitauei TaxID=669202 RepID=A0A0C2MV77_THEKT|nr:hypothetical protein RF11_11761 [Thelohanellus kitauei]